MSVRCMASAGRSWRSDMALRPEPYHTLALCAGAGGLELGVELARPGARCVAYVEREAYAAATLVARMEAGQLAPAPIWSDLATFDARPFSGVVDCVTSGDPCQPNSVAGRGLGTADARFLLNRAVEIYDDSGATRFCRENVTGNADGQLAVAVPLLEGLGCRVAAGIFRASDVGSSHQRERLIIMADRDGGQSGSRCRDAGEVRRLSEAERQSEHGASISGRGRGELADARGGDGASRPDVARGSKSQGSAGQSGRSGVLLDDAERSERGQIGAACHLRGRDGLPQRQEGSGGLGASDFELVYATGGGRGREGHHGVAPAGPASAVGKMGDAHREGLEERQLDPEQRGALRDEGTTAGADGAGVVPILTPEPADLRWLDILGADLLYRPALGRIDLWALTRRNLGLPPVVAAIGRRGGMAWDLDEATTALVKREVRRISDGLANRVDRLRLCGNGVHPLAAGYAWLALDALLADAATGDVAVRSAA